MKIKTYIEQFNPCDKSVEFLSQFDNPLDAWNACERGDWMLDAAHNLGVDLKVLTLAKVECAETVRHLMKDERSLKALDVARKFAHGEATREELDATSSVASASAAYSAAAYSAYSAYSARKENRMETANICRRVLTDTIIELLENKQ